MNKEEIQIINKQMKRYLTSYIIKELGIITMRYHYMPIRMTK